MGLKSKDTVTIVLTKEEYSDLLRALRAYMSHLEISGRFVRELGEWHTKVLRIVGKIAPSGRKSKV